MKRILSIIGMVLTSLCYGQYEQAAFSTGLTTSEVSGSSFTSKAFAGGVMGSEVLTGGSYSLTNGLISSTSQSENEEPEEVVYDFNISGGNDGEGNQIFDLSKVSRRDGTTRTLDVDNDSDLDVVRAGGPNNTELQFFINDGSGDFTIQTEFTYENPITFEIGDLDGDDDQDIIVYGRSTEGTRFYIHQNQAGSFAAPIASTPITVLRTFDIADVDNDGLNDIVIGGFNPDNILWAKNEGNLSFANTSILIPEVNHNNRRLRFLEMVDFDDDGDLDAFVVTDGVAGSSSIAGYININNGGTFASSNFSQLNSIPQNDFDIADFNDDGFMDFVVTEVSSRTVNVLLNDGANGFPSTNLITYTPNNDGRVPRNVVGVESVDFDTDGDMDIYVGEVFLQSGANGILFENDGFANFTLHDETIADALMVSIDAGTGAFTKQVFDGDFNGDGRVDILTNSNDDGDLILHEQSVDGSYERSYLNTYMSRLNRLQYVDVDGDGFKDFVSVDRTDYGKTIISLGDGTGAFSAQQAVIDNIPFSPRDVLFGDWDGNSTADLIYANQDRVYLVADALGASPGDTTTLYTSTPGEYGGSIGNSLDHALALVDIDGDGDNDLFVTDNAATADNVAWIENTGSGFTEHFQSGLEIDGYKLADLNADDHLDLVFTDYVNAISPNYVRVALFDTNTSNWVISHEEDIGGSSAALFALADVDVDGDKDIVFRGNWKENTGNGVFADAASYAGNISGSDNLIGADINMDGREDVVVVSAVASTSYLNVYINEGEDKFTLLPIGGAVLPFGNSDGELLIDDFDEDGRLDIASAFAGGGRSKLPLWFRTCFNSSSEISATACGVYNAPSGATFTESGIFEDIIPNSIGCDSVITVNLTIIDCAGGEAYDFSASAGNIVPAENITAPQEHGAIWDYDDDGDMDFVVGGNLNSERLKVFVNNNGDFSEIVDIEFGVNFEDFVLADFDNDGDDDFAIGFNGTLGDGNSLYVWENLGGGDFGDPTPISTTQFGILEIGEFSNDGFPDIIAQTVAGSSSTFNLLVNNGDFSFASPVELAGPFSNFSYINVFDIEGDNDTDLYVRANDDLLLVNDGSNAFTQTTLAGGGSGTFSTNPIVFGHFNTDSFLDYARLQILGSFDNEVSISLNNGDNTFSSTALKAFFRNPFIGKNLNTLDLDNNGSLDLIVMKTSAGGTSGFGDIFINDGSGGFSESSNTLSNAIATGSPNKLVNEIFSDDFDNDGDTDVITYTHRDGDIILHEQDADGSFSSINYLNYFSSAITRLQVMDLDGDGYQDVISTEAQRSSGKTFAFYGDGTGEFTDYEAIFDNIGSDGYDVILGDWNGNSAIDLIYTSSVAVFVINDAFDPSIDSDTTQLYTSNAPNSFSGNISVNNSEVNPLELIDIDGDGDLDLFVADIGPSPEGAIAWIENDGTATGVIHQQIGFFSMGSFDLGKINSDDQIDLVYYISGSYYVSFFDSSADQFGTGTELTSTNSNINFTLSDIDNDADLDIVYSGLNWIENTDGEGTFGTSQSLNISQGVSGEITSEDINNDGTEDLILSAFGQSNSVKALLNNGDLTFEVLDYVQQAGSQGIAIDNTNRIKIADVTGNGINDILTSGSTGSANWVPIIYTNCFNTSSEITEFSCGPFTGPSGATFTESGIFEDIIPNSIGCDSVITINLTVNPIYEETSTLSICEGETYTFGTQSLTTAGEFTEIFQSQAGCDSTVVLTLTVNPVYNETAEATICDNETFAFGTQSLNTAGEFTEIFQSVTGCDSTVVLSLSVNPTFAITTSVLIATNETFDFDGNTLDSDGQYEASLSTILGCDSLVTLNLQVNSPPTVPSYTFSIDENSPELTLVGTIVVTDPDNDVLTYSIISGNEQDAFAITDNGRIIVAEPSVLDFESNPTFILEVEISDGLVTVSSTISINLTDVNENTAPTIADQTFAIDENSANGTAVGTIVAADAESDALTYSITGGNTNAFALDASTGSLTVANASELDFETTPSFALIVEVADAELSATATITINLTDVNENTAPQIADQTFTVDENNAVGAVVGTIVATDAESDVLTYSITGGNTNDAFALDASTGALTVANASELDFEATPSFTLIVEVADSELTASAMITINLTDVNENTAPTIADQTFSIDENSQNGTVIGVVVANDVEMDDLTFALVNSDDTFIIDESSGELSVGNSQSLDYELVNSFEILVSVSDGDQESTATMTIDLIDLDDTPPIISSDPSITVSENVTGVIYSAAANESATFSLGAAKDEVLFSMTASGALRFISSPDFENPEDANADNVYVIDLIATDAFDNSTTFELTILVTDIDEPVLANEFRSIEMSIYPNPASHQVVINTEKRSQLIIVDMAGTEQIRAFTNETINISKLAKGIYTVIIGTKTKKLMIK